MLRKDQLIDLEAPVVTAQIAAYMGSFDEEHYHTVAFALQFAYRLAQGLPRLRCHAPGIQGCIKALNAAWDRGVRFAGIEEVIRIDEGLETYKSLLRVTHVTHVRKALARAAGDFK